MHQSRKSDRRFRSAGAQGLDGSYESEVLHCGILAEITGVDCCQCISLGIISTDLSGSDNIKHELLAVHGSSDGAFSVVCNTPSSP